jgi:hypothetical protein
MLHDGEPQVLRPFHRSEAFPIAEAADVAGRSVRTIREWCARFDIGRRIGGQWAVSKVGLAMLLDGNKAALAAYLTGDRSPPTITAYFERCGVPLPRPRSDNQLVPMVGIREEALSEPMGISRS